MNEILTGNNVYFPLSAGNKWNYQIKDNISYVNSVVSVSPSNPCEFSMFNTASNTSVIIKKEGLNYLTNSYEASKMICFLKDDLKKGDVFEINFTANTIESSLVVTVKEKGITKEVLGKKYSDVLFFEAESKMKMNGNLIPLNYFTQYYYAKGIGLIETSTSSGDLHQLTSYELK